MDLVSYWQQPCAPYIRARFGRDEEGASLVEYALLVALIAIVIAVAVGFFGNQLSTFFQNIGNTVKSWT